MPTTVTILLANSGGPVDALELYDTIANQTRFGPSHFATNDAATVPGFAVRDASRLVTDFQIIDGGVVRYDLQDVEGGTIIDVFTGQPPT